MTFNSVKQNFQRCIRCVMDTTDPDIKFNLEGICSHCDFFDHFIKPRWPLMGGNSEHKLLEIAEKIRIKGKDNEYDCIIGVSGGIDSSYLLHVATTVMKLRPLAVHVDAGWNSEQAVSNIEKLVKKLKIDLFTYVVDWEEMRDLQVAYLKSGVANQDVPQDHAFFAKLYEFAVKNGIRYVLTGSNFATESILPTSWGHNAMDGRQLNAIHAIFGKKRLKTFPTVSFFQYYFFYPIVKKMVRFAPLNYLPYNKEEAMHFLEREYGWQYYGGKHHESRWTKFFQSYFLPVRFAYDKRKAHLSSLICSGQMAREVALKELESLPYDPITISDDIEFVMRKLQLTKREFDQIINLPKRSYVDYPNNDFRVKIIHQINSVCKSIVK